MDDALCWVSPPVIKKGQSDLYNSFYKAAIAVISDSLFNMSKKGNLHFVGRGLALLPYFWDHIDWEEPDAVEEPGTH